MYARGEFDGAAGRRKGPAKPARAGGLRPGEEGDMAKRRIRRGWKKWAAAGMLAWGGLPAETQAFFPPIFNTPPPSDPTFGPPVPPPPPVVVPPPTSTVPPPPFVPPPPPPAVPPPPVVVPPVPPPAQTPEPATVVSGILGLLAVTGYQVSRRRKK
ncbi:MAG TPA: hypothetical protein VIL46_12285 [Gemmataceae bacterium]